MKSASLAVAAAYLVAAVAAQASNTRTAGIEAPSAAPTAGAAVVQGCFSSHGDLEFNSNETYNSIGKCGSQICNQALGKYVGATTQGKECWCGNTYPPQSSRVDDSYCDAPCTGWPHDACGGGKYWTVYNTGIELYDVDYADSTSSTSSGVSTSAVATISGHTVVVTATSSSTSTSAPSGPSAAGIAAGVVVGVVVVGAVIGGLFFYMRRRRNREIEEDHRRNAAVNSFINGGHPPSSSSGFSDARLDPVMAQRRMSDGSIADNQDYSRKILRVTNA